MTMQTNGPIRVYTQKARSKLWAKEYSELNQSGPRSSQHLFKIEMQSMPLT